MTKIIGLYHYEEEDGQPVTQYDTLCDGVIEDKYDVGVIAGIIGHEVKLGRKPIVSVFLPKGDIEMETRQVDENTGEIIEGSMGEAKSPFIGQMLELSKAVEDSDVGKAIARVDIVKDAQMQRLLQQLADVERWANTVVVASLEDDKKVTNDLVIIAQIQDGIKERTAQLLKPYQPYIDEAENIKSMVKKILVNPLSAADVLVRGKVLAYRRRKKDEVQQVKNENLAIVHEALAQAEVAGQKVTLPDTIKPTGQAPPKTVRSEMGSSTTIEKRAWSFKENLTHEQIMAGLPTQYKMANLSLINDAVRKNKQLGEADFGNVIDIYPDDGLRINKRKVK